MSLSIDQVRNFLEAAFTDVCDGFHPTGGGDGLQSILRIDLNHLASEKRQWRSRLSQWAGVEVTHHSGDRDSRCRVLCRFLIPDPTSSAPTTRPVYYRRNEVRLQHDDGGGIWLCGGDQAGQEVSAWVASIDQIEQFVHLVLKHHHHQAARRRKRERIRELRLSAIRARLNQWAFRSDFTWYLRVDDESVDVAVAGLSHRSLVKAISIDDFESQHETIGAALVSCRTSKTQQASVIPDAEWNRWVETATKVSRGSVHNE